MAKIAVTSGEAGNRPARRLLASGDGWSASEVVCTLGPGDRTFEEQHSSLSIAIVAAGTFQYRSHAGSALMTPGSLLLGSTGQCFECGHEHGTGDRCISFSYTQEFFDRLDAAPSFRSLRVPPVRALSPVIARASAALSGAAYTFWEEIGIGLAGLAAQLDRGEKQEAKSISAAGIARVARIVRTLERDPDSPRDLSALAHEARLSPYHFLRMFQSITGVTPHQYLLRLRMQRAAVRLVREPAKIVEIALECGFGDVSNFNRTFRAEFGVSPRGWRRATI